MTVTRCWWSSSLSEHLGIVKHLLLWSWRSTQDSPCRSFVLCKAGHWSDVCSSKMRRSAKSWETHTQTQKEAFGYSQKGRIFALMLPLWFGFHWRRLRVWWCSPDWNKHRIVEEGSITGRTAQRVRLGSFGKKLKCHQAWQEPWLTPFCFSCCWAAENCHTSLSSSLAQRTQRHFCNSHAAGRLQSSNSTEHFRNQSQGTQRLLEL